MYIYNFVFMIYHVTNISSRKTNEMTDTTLLLPNQYLLYINNVSMTMHVDVKQRLRFCIELVFEMLFY